MFVCVRVCVRARVRVYTYLHTDLDRCIRIYLMKHIRVCSLRNGEGHRP